MADMTLEKARELLDGTTPGPWRVPYTFFMPMDMKVASDLARAYIAQAAEITRLQVRLADGDDWDGLLAEARGEAAKAMRKFPQPNYVISKIAEEAGEVVKAAIHCAEGRETADNLRNEMRQTIAMLYRLWIEGDAVHGLPPVRTALSTFQEAGK